MHTRVLREEDISAVEAIFDLHWSGYFRAHLSERLHSANMDWIIAEDGDEIVGIAASRKAPELMRKFAKSDRVVEFYVVAVKIKERGIGTILRNGLIEQARADEYKEMVFFSANSHQDSWKFHDNSEFKRVGEHISPDGETGVIWLMDL